MSFSPGSTGDGGVGLASTMTGAPVASFLAPTPPAPNFFERLDAGFTKLNASPLFQFGMGMLREGGPSTTPHSFGQDLSRAMGTLPAQVNNGIAMNRGMDQFNFSNKLWDQNINPQTLQPFPQAPMAVSGGGGMSQMAPIQGPQMMPAPAPAPMAPGAAPAPAAPAQTASGAVAQPAPAAPASAPATPAPTPAPGYQAGAAYAAGLPQTPLSPNYNGPPIAPIPGTVSAPPMAPGQVAPVATGAPQQLGISPNYNQDLKAGENPNMPRGSWNGPDNGTTSARGDYQIIDSTWKNAAKRAGVDPENPTPSAEDQDKVLEVLKEDDAKRLKANDIPVNDTNMKVLHILGPKGVALLKAKESTPADMVVGKKAIENNPGLFREDKGKGPIRTVGEVKDFIAKKYKASDEQVAAWGGKKGEQKQPDSVIAAGEAGMAPTEMLQAFTQMPPEVKQDLLLGAMYASGGDRVAFSQAFGKAMMEYTLKGADDYRSRLAKGLPGGIEITGGGTVGLMPNGETKQLVMTNRGHMEQYLDQNGNVAFRPPPNGWRPTTPSTGGYLSPKDWTKLNQDLRVEQSGLMNLRKYYDTVGGLKPGVDRWANRLHSNLKTFFGNQHLTDQEYFQKVGETKLQTMIGANRLDFLGPGTVTEYDAQRIIDAIAGSPQSAFQNPRVLEKVLQDLWETKYTRAKGLYDDYVRNHHVYGGGVPPKPWDVPEKLPQMEVNRQYEQDQKDKGTKTFKPDANGVWDLR